MDNMLEMYLYETNTLMEQLDELLIEAEKNEAFTTNDVNEIFRIMHTIKGSSAMMEFSTLMEIAHHIEDLFFYIRENGMDSLDESHKSDLFNLMFQSTDALRVEVEKIENDEPLSSNIDQIIANINSFLEKISSSGNSSSDTSSGKESAAADAAPAADADAIAAINQELAGCPKSDLPYFIRIRFEVGSGMENLRAFMVITALNEIELNFEHYPEDVESAADTCESIVENGFFIALSSHEDVEKAIPILKIQNSIETYEVIENVATKASKKPEPAAKAVSASKPAAAVPAVDTSSAAEPAKPAAPGTPAHTGAPVKQSLISVNLSKLDSLVAIVGEIVITESMVTSSPDLQNLKLDNFLKSARQLRKLTGDLQDIAMSLRMVPLAGTFQKMNRIVRDMKKKLNKDVRLTLIGENTEVDKTVVDSIGDPIMHIVRNSMDHGVETNVEDRIAAGKKPQAEIVLSAAHTGSEVIISISDDGQGKILAKAERNGILTKPASDYSKKEILSLLLLPGFSTNEEVTEFSGRGVGMDVVKKNVEAVGGTISITSELGKGSCTTLKIPLTMAITDGMEVSVGKSMFTIPIANIRQSFKTQKEDVILDASGNEIIKCQDAFYPIIRIHDLYNIETEVTNIEDGILIWVETADKSYCLFVDELLGEQQVVVKPLSPFLSNFNIKDSGIGGCTILGDGNISLILDISNLYAATQGLY